MRPHDWIGRLSIAQVWLVDPAYRGNASDSAALRALTAFGRWLLGERQRCEKPVCFHYFSLHTYILYSTYIYISVQHFAYRTLDLANTEAPILCSAGWFVTNIPLCVGHWQQDFMEAYISLPTLCRFSGDFDIHYFVSAKKLTKWAAAFAERGRAHVVMQCDSVQILQPNSQGFCRWFVFFLKGDLSQRYPTKQDVDLAFKRLAYSRRTKDLFHSWQRSRFLQRSLGRGCHKFADPQLQVGWNPFFLNFCDIWLYLWCTFLLVSLNDMTLLQVNI